MVTDPDEVDHEYQRLVGTDDVAGAALAVTEPRRDGDAAATADLHPGHALVPALDDLTLGETELEGVAAVPRGVELLARRPRHAHIVHLDDLAGGGLVAIADHDVLQLQLVGGLLRGDLYLGLLVECHSGTVTAGPAPH